MNHGLGFPGLKFFVDPDPNFCTMFYDKRPPGSTFGHRLKERGLLTQNQGNGLIDSNDDKRIYLPASLKYQESPYLSPNRWDHRWKFKGMRRCAKTESGFVWFDELIGQEAREYMIEQGRIATGTKLLPSYRREATAYELRTLDSPYQGDIVLVCESITGSPGMDGAYITFSRKWARDDNKADQTWARLMVQLLLSDKQVREEPRSYEQMLKDLCPDFRWVWKQEKAASAQTSDERVI
jgi:hypothetical protein